MSRRLWHCSRFVENLVERLAPFERRRVGLGQNGAQHLRHILELISFR